jgi:amino acid adenylation domain-containing protein
MSDFRESAAQTLGALLRQRAEAAPDSCGYTFLLDGEDQTASLTYSELDQRALALAGWLREHARPGDRVLVLLPPGLDFIASFFACMYAGLTAVPVPLPHGQRGMARTLAIVADCEPVVVLANTPVVQSLSAVKDAGVAALNALTWLNVGEQPTAAAVESFQSVRPDALAFLQYTSGSTGIPKGVALSHRNLLANEAMIQRAFGHTSDSLIVGWLPPHHDMGLIGNILQPLYVGVPCIQMSPPSFLMKPLRWLRAISRYRATTSGAPSFAYDLCIKRTTPEQRAELDLSAWRVAFNGAEPIRAQTMQHFSEAFAVSGFRPHAFYPCYGLAEATLLVSGGLPGAGPHVQAVERSALEQGSLRVSPQTDASVDLVSCGEVDLGTEVCVVDPHTQQVCREGQVGEIWLRGDSVACGYWRRRELSEQIFQATTADGAGPYLRTGDLGSVHAGALYITGRLKDLIIVRGRNLYPQDLEQTVETVDALLRPSGGAAFAVEHAGEERVVLVHEVSRCTQEQAAQLVLAIRRAIGEQFEVAVHAVVLIKPGTLPRTTSGKVQRAACKQAFGSGSLAVVLQVFSDSQTPVSDAQPLTELEARVAEIWVEVLSCGLLTRETSFLDVGGDSLSAMQICVRIREQLGVALEPFELFEANTLTALAELLRPRAQVSAEPVVARGERVPLTYVQERLWFLQQLSADKPVYHIAGCVQLTGVLNVPALQAAIRCMTERHEGLRTRFAVDAGRPYQQFDAALPAVALEDCSRAELDEALQRWASEPFALDRAAVRWRLLRLTGTEHVLACSMHHLISDGWSIARLLEQLAAAYRALPVASAQPAQFADYAFWQRSEATRPDAQAALRYWSERFQTVPEPLRLPHDRPRGASLSHAGRRAQLELAPELIRALTQLGRAHNATLYCTLLAGLAILLRRYTGQSDLCIGVPVTDRPRAAWEQTFGCFLNTFALRFSAEPAHSVRALIAEVRARMFEAQQHQHVPFERLLESLPRAQGSHGAALYQVMFSMQPSMPQLLLPGLKTTVQQLDLHTAQFELALDVSVRADGSALAAWEYATDVFDADTIAQLAGDFTRVLRAMAQAPTQRISDLPLMAAQKAPLRQPVPEHCVHELFEQAVQRAPDALAISHAGRELTYAQLNALANRLARRLRARGVSTESLVAVYLDRGAELVVAVLAILKAGGAYVPFDPAQPVQRTLGALAGVACVVTDTGLASRLPDSLATICIDRDLDEADASDLGLALPFERAAYVIYTSGSTGAPKGVIVSQRSAANAVLAWRQTYDLHAGPRLLQIASPAFDVWSADWMRALCSGGSLVIEQPAQYLDPAALSALLETQRVELVDLVPSLLSPLLAYWQRRGRAVDTLRLIVVGSEAWPIEDYRALLTAAPRARVLSCYGVTEACIDSAYFEAAAASCRDWVGHVPLGRAFPNTQLYVLDEYGQPAAAGVAGELCIGGEGVARGYLGNPGLTALRFVPDAFSGVAGARLYRTGDKARRLRDGRLEFLGRLDHQLKVRGVRFEAAEVEACLRRHPAVAAALVQLSPTAALTAYLVGSDVADDVLRAYLREQLPAPLVPACFVWLASFPLNASGKVDRAKLPDPVATEVTRALTVAPRSELERSIAEVWSEVLERSALSVHDNFFDLGGHSLLLTRVAAGLHAKLAREIGISMLFEHPSIASLAAALTGGEREQVSASVSDEASNQQRRAALYARRRTGSE